MQFSPKQKSVIQKAVDNNYLSSRMSPEAIDMLLKIEPKNQYEANHIIGLVMAVAYGKGDGIGDIWHPVKRSAEQDRLAKLLTGILLNYAV